MTRVGLWIYRWRRSWQSWRHSRLAGVREHHRSMLLWMLRHPWKASKP